jgi:hypothetical protein
MTKRAKRDAWGEGYKKTQAEYLAELKREADAKQKGGKR